MAEPKNYFAGTEFTDSIANEKRALLALIAERGSEGQAEWNRAQELSNAARTSGLELAAARGAAVNAPPALQTGISQDYDKINMAYRDAMAQSSLGHGREMDRIALANSAYKDAMIAQQPQFAAAMAAQAAAAAAARSGGGGGGSSSSGGLMPTGPEGAPLQEVIDNELRDPLSWMNLDIDELGYLGVPTVTPPKPKISGSVGNVDMPSRSGRRTVNTVGRPGPNTPTSARRTAPGRTSAMGRPGPNTRRTVTGPRTPNSRTTGRTANGGRPGPTVRRGQ